MRMYMSLEEIYNLIQNPVSAENLPNLFHLLAKNNSVYNALLGGRNAEIVERGNDAEMQIKLAERWRQELSAMTDDEIEEKEKRTGNFRTLPMNCRNLPQIKTYDEAMFLLGQIPDQFGWTYKDSGWEYFQSTDLIGEVDHKRNMNIRFYINCSLENIGDFVEEIIERCKVAELPVFLKTLMNDTARKDRILLWAEPKDIGQYLLVLQDILKDNPQWQMEEPPVLTGKVLNGIGVASEPNEEQQQGKQGNDRHSFNTLRSQAIFETNEDMLKLAFSQIPLEKPYNISNKFFEFLCEEISRGLRFRKVEQTAQQIHQQLMNDSEFIKLLAEKIRSSNFSEAKITISGTEYRFVADVKRTMIRCLPYIDSDLKGFNQEYASELKKRLLAQGIDGEKICFNSNTLDEFKRIDTANSTLSDDPNMNL